MLVVGQTGVGKSSFSRQMALHFAAGMPFVGLEPVRQLRSLIIQAENDDRDESEMCKGVVDGSGFTQEQIDSAGPFIFHFREQERSGFRFFLETVEPLIKQVKPDLLWIDPLLAYLGADQNSQQEVSPWLRNSLNPIITKYNCGAILVHHTNKLTLKALKDSWSSSDLGYFGADSAEFSNWSRAILCLVPTKTKGLYGLNASKRGGRLHWTDGVGALTTQKLIQHSREMGRIHWQEAKDENGGLLVDQPVTSGKPIPSVEEFLTIFPTTRFMKNPTPRDFLLEASEIRNLFSQRGWKRDSYAGVCAEAVRQKRVKMVNEGRGNRIKLYGLPDKIDDYLASRRANKGETSDAKD